MPATVAYPNRSLDSEQISPATIAHHTVYEKTPNLHQSHIICQWGAQPYLVGPLSRLVGKPPLSPWVSTNVLPLTQGGNYTNSAISLTEIFDRIFFMCVNSVGFVVQIEKSGDRGTIVFTATLKACFRLSLSTRNKKKRMVTSKKHASRPETSYWVYYSFKPANGIQPTCCGDYQCST